MTRASRFGTSIITTAMTADTRARFPFAARGLLEDSAQALSLHDIAARAGATPPLIVRYFGANEGWSLKR